MMPTQESNEKIAVLYNEASSDEGELMVHSLASSGNEVVVITRSLEIGDDTALFLLEHVTVKVVDTYDCEELASSISGVDRVVLVTKYWERFQDSDEEMQAMVLIHACHDAGVDDLLFCSIEDTKALREQGLYSQIRYNKQGKIRPKFRGMTSAQEEAEDLQVHLTHMFTSYVDTKKSRTSLCLIWMNGKLIVTPFFGDDGIDGGIRADLKSIEDFSSVGSSSVGSDSEEVGQSSLVPQRYDVSFAVQPEIFVILIVITVAVFFSLPQVHDFLPVIRQVAREEIGTASRYEPPPLSFFI